MKEEKVGYMNPPKSSQFKPGQSGNSKGRPKGSKNTYKLLDDLLNQKVQITQDGKQIKINKKTMSLLQLINLAAKGDVKAIQTLLPHMLAVDEKNEHKERMSDALRRDDKSIIEGYFKKRTSSETDDTTKEIIDV